MSAVLENLISKYDGIGWIPTIRGCLSLDMIDDAKSILGDTDKYSIRFKRINGLHSEHYLIASSLLTVNDSKGGSDYIRTYRYIFTGSIKTDEAAIRSFLKEKGDADNAELQKYIEDDGLLIGRLVIVASEKVEETETEKSRLVFTHWLATEEVTLLRGLQELTELNQEFQYQFSMEAASMTDLQTTREKMLEKWTKLESTARKIEDDTESRRPTFCFEVVLTRDGILLLKDVTRKEYRNYFAEPDSADDYKQNLPLHRLFKSAMNYMKYLFHSNYHHNEEHDTYLPASNLHSAKRADGTLDLYKVFRHQLDAFFVPLVKLKRASFSSYTVDPMGIILYAKAFIRVSESNHLVNLDVTSKAKEHCEILQREIEHMTSKHKTIVNALTTQHNPFVIATGLLGFVFTCLKTIDVLDLHLSQFFPLIEVFPQPYYGITKFLILAVIGYLLYIIPRSRTLQKQFKPKEKKLQFKLKKKLKGWIFKNSNLDERRFSRWYDLNIYFNSMLLYVNVWLRKPRKKEVRYDYLSIFLNVALIVFSIAAIVLIIWLLRGYVASIF